jgi:CRISPR-associated protein Csb2
MLCITVELLDGMIATGAPDDIALTGQEDAGEWPPSPARLFSALVAADGTGERCRLTDGAELLRLEAAGAPTIVADARREVLVSPQVPRYVPADKTDRGVVQEYVGRKATLVRTAPRLSPRNPSVAYVWPSLDLQATHHAALRTRAARVGYLGHASCSVRLRVSDTLPAELLDDPSRRWEPTVDGSVDLPVPFSGLVDVLDRMYAAFSAGEPTRRSWYRADRARYRPPGRTTTPVGADVRVVWLRLAGSVSGRHVLRLTEALRGAVLGAYDRQFGQSADDLPAVLHGHVNTEGDFEHVSWLALPDVEGKHPTGRVHGMAIMLPGDCPAAVLEGVRNAVRFIDELRLGSGGSVGLAPHAGEQHPWASNPRRWTAAARRWHSAFPVVHERFVRPRPDLSEVARWCRHAGFPAPIEARLSRMPLLPGSVALMPHEARRSGVDARPYSHLELGFNEPVKGPMVLGHLRHFGLGLMVPQSEPKGGGTDG